MKMLRDEYATGLLERFNQMRAMLSEIGCDTHNKGALKELFRHVHSLSGSSATFGFAYLSRLSQMLEAEVKAFLDQDALPNNTQLEALLTSVSELQKLAENGPDQSIVELLPMEGRERTDSSDTDVYTLYLVEDDNEMGREMVSQLEHMGYITQLFPDATSAYQAISGQNPDAILIDIMLPEGEYGGPELANAICEVGNADVPAIFFS